MVFFLISNLLQLKIKNTLHPLVMSSFHLKFGTYASLCKFSEYDNRYKITQAYWLVSPVSFFKEFTLISYSISEDSNVRLKIADLMGRVVYSEHIFKNQGNLLVT
jgi:hypothetical protein